ncbi:MAG: hypothetical protein U0835_00175 [Isosphaeraceae bacterium]
MADLSEVESTLVAVIAQVVYPGGTGNPPIAGGRVDIYRGWPIPADLDADLAAGTVNISVFPIDNERITTRYPREWRPLPLVAPSLTLTAAGDSITVGGTPSSPLNAAAIVDGTAYIYPVQPGDTAEAVATGLAALIAADTIATSDGPVVAVPGAHSLDARVGGVGATIREVRRQRRTFAITFWCPDPAVRDAIAAAVDAALADIDFLALPDGTAGRLLYERSKVSDRVEREGVYRRDLFYSVEYATTDRTDAVQIVVAAAILERDYVESPAEPPSLMLESGGYLLLESGHRILPES